MESIDFHGLPAVRLRTADGASAVATLQGAQLVSWIPRGGEECLYVSERSPFETGRPVRGGVPVVFPQFAERGPLAHHGFARTLAWRIAGEYENGFTFALESTGETLRVWPHPFVLELDLAIGGARLDMELRARNIGNAPFAFNAALHTYLRVPDATAVRLEGLSGARYVDRGDTASRVDEREFVTAAEPIDRVYLSPSPRTRVEDGARRLGIAQRGFPDTVVWNPGRERTATMADMPPEGYRQMLCVEAAAFEHAIVLAPGNEWAGGQSIIASANR